MFISQKCVVCFDINIKTLMNKLEKNIENHPPDYLLFQEQAINKDSKKSLPAHTAQCESKLRWLIEFCK